MHLLFHVRTRLSTLFLKTKRAPIQHMFLLEQQKQFCEVSDYKTTALLLLLQTLEKNKYAIEQ